MLVAPIAFVSEHSETLVELDIEYRHVAEAAGVPAYLRVPTVSAEASFIAGLERLVQAALSRPSASIAPDGGARLCPGRWNACPVPR